MKITQENWPDRALMFGDPTFLGTLTSTGTSVNSSTVTAIGDLSTKAVLIWADAQGFVITTSSDSGTAAKSGTTGVAVVINANDPKTFRVKQGNHRLAFISNSGTANLYIFELS